MTKEGSTKTVNFMTPGAGVFVQGLGRISHRANMYYFLQIAFSTRGIVQTN